MWFPKKTVDDDNEDALVLPAYVARTLPAGFFTIHVQGESHVSARCAELFNVPSTCTNIDALMTALPSATADKLQAWLHTLNVTQPLKTLVLEISASKETGVQRVLELTGYAMVRVDGTLDAQVVWVLDATESQRQLQRLHIEGSKLKQEIKQFSTILNMAPYPIWQRDQSLKLQFCNLSYSELVEDIAERDATQILPDIDKKSRQLAASALQDNQSKRDRRHIVVNGQRKFFQLDELPVVDQAMVVGFGQDISEIEALNEELKHYMSAQSDLLESSASAMAIYGPDMRLKSFNYAFVSLWKLDESWLESEPTYSEVLEALRENRKLPEQANFQTFKQQQLRLFTELMEPREEFFYLPDGKTLRVIAITHALGGILFAYEDVTDRLALERSYNTLIAVQRETLDHLHEGIAVFGEDGRLKLSNPVYLKMWDIPEDFIQTEPHIRDIVEHVKKYYYYEGDWEIFREQRVAQLQSRQNQKYRIERRDGVVIECSVVPLPDGATLINFIDVTDSILVERSLRERNEALQDADRVKTEFLANVSYELRSPLTSIAGFSDMLRQEYFGALTEKQHEYVDGIYLSSQHLMDLVNDILDLSSIEAGFMQLETHEFDIQRLADSALSLVQERARRQELNLTIECDANIGMMVGDEMRIKQCLLNLLSNAVRFCQAGGAVTLGVRTLNDSSMVAFFVRDNGPGIPAEEVPYIFNKFYKGKNEAIPKAKSKAGTGLGLSMVKSFVELHGGTVEVTSVPSDTVFTCIFPRQVQVKS